jgi:single-strand DNA-binding protein
MYLNRITLIGFIGSDAERKAANATNIAIFSLATKTSWKNDAGSWESRTEWHRCVAFGKLADFAGTLSKGAHVAVEGELRSHEYQRELAVGSQKPPSPSESGKSVSTPFRSSIAPPNAKPLTRIKRRCPAKGHLLFTFHGRASTARSHVDWAASFMLPLPRNTDDAVRPSAQTKLRLLSRTAFVRAVCRWACLCSGYREFDQFERQRRHCEEIEGDDDLPVVLEKRQPRFTWIAPASHATQIPGDSPLRDNKSELQQLAVDLGGSPIRVLSR